MFNENLRLIREKKGISQTNMAKAVGIPVSTYRNYEKTTRQPSYETLIQIASILEISIDALLENKTEYGMYSDLFYRIKKLPAESIKELDVFVSYLNYKYFSKK